MSKIYGILGVILHGVQSFLSPRIDWNFRHLSSCDTKDHDETRGTSVSHDFSSSWANRRVTLLITIVGLTIQIVIQLFFKTKLIVFEITM